VNNLYDFLEYPIVDEPVAFDPLKDYREMFSSDHLREVAYVVRSLASDECWKQLRHYFLDWISGPDDKVLDAPREPPKLAWLLSFPNSVSLFHLFIY